jgi:hypothetical protein
MEYTADGINFRTVPALPRGEEMFDHFSTVLPATGDIFVGSTDSKKCFLYIQARNQWTKCPEMLTQRTMGTCCGVITTGFGKYEIVLAGGWVDPGRVDKIYPDDGLDKSVQIYSLVDSRWRTG